MWVSGVTAHGSNHGLSGSDRIPTPLTGVLGVNSGGWTGAGGTSASAIVNATDGKLETHTIQGIIAGDVTEDITVWDMGALYNISEVLYWITHNSIDAGGHQMLTDIETSPDNSSWTSIAALVTNGAASPGNTEDKSAIVQLTDARIRYIRTRCRLGNVACDSGYYEIHSLGVRGVI